MRDERTCATCTYYDDAKRECHWTAPPALVALAASMTTKPAAHIDHNAVLVGPFATAPDLWCSGWEKATEPSRRVARKNWRRMHTAPMDGTVVEVRRILGARVVFSGPARWGRFTAPPLVDRLSGQQYASAADEMAWMHPVGSAEQNYQVTSPTDWRPAESN